MSNLYTCFICLSDFEEDDIVWADQEGNIENHTYAYCVGCLPPQKEEEE
jgi:hypothetical protein